MFPSGIARSIAGTLIFNSSPRSGSMARPAASRLLRLSSHALAFASRDRTRSPEAHVVVGRRTEYRQHPAFPGCARCRCRPTPIWLRGFDLIATFCCTGGGAVLVVESGEEVERRGVRTYCKWRMGAGLRRLHVGDLHPEGSVRGGHDQRLRQRASAGAVDYVTRMPPRHPSANLERRRSSRLPGGHYASAIAAPKALTGHGVCWRGMESPSVPRLKEVSFPLGHISDSTRPAKVLNIIRSTLSQQPRVLNNSSGWRANVALSCARREQACGSLSSAVGHRRQHRLGVGWEMLLEEGCGWGGAQPGGCRCGGVHGSGA